MSLYYKELRAGRYCMGVAYSRTVRTDGPQARAEKHRQSSKAQKLLNDKASRLQLTGIIAENFADSRTALFCSPTFDDAHYPEYPKQSLYWEYCIRQAKKYVARLGYLARRRGDAIRYCFCPGIGAGGRWHIHLLVDGVTKDDVEAAWQLGDIEAHSLYADREWITAREWGSSKTDNVNPVAIAKYMMANASCRLVGKHPWHASRSCVRPKVQTARTIRDALDVQPPEGAEILSQENVSTLYSSFALYEYILPRPQSKAKRPRARRRRE